ncbi:MAG TPA: GntR family transcriptional regulator [Anaerolineales bacterium]
MTDPNATGKGLKPIRESRLLPRLAVEQLRAMIHSGELPAGSQLPSEPELAKALNISRSTLRAALSYLENEGTVLRRRGVGTFVADRGSLYNNLNINWGVTQIIQATGAVPGTSEVQFDVQPASRRIEEHLKIPLGTPIIIIERVRTADKKPVSISVDHLAVSRLATTATVDESIERFRSFLETHQSIYEYFEQELNLAISHATAWVRPMVADTNMARSLDVPLHSPILYLEQIDYDPAGNPLLLTDEYFAGDSFTFSVHRSS